MANIKMKTLTVGKDVFEIVDEQAREDIKELQENGVKTSVKSVNGKTGVVTLNASDVGALSASDIVDGLTSTESNKALSARSGFQLNSNLTTLRNEFNNLEGDGTIEVDMEEGTFSHKDSGVAASWYGEQGGGDLSFGGSFTVPGALNIDAKGHITEAKDNQFKLPDNEATETKKGLLSPTDKAKLNKLKPPFNFEIGANTASNVDVNVTLFDSDDGEVARFGVVGTGRATVSENSAGALRINVADQDLSAYAKNTDVDTKIATVEKKIPTVAQDIGDSTTATMSQEVISRKLYEIRNTDIEQTERIDSLSEEIADLTAYATPQMYEGTDTEKIQQAINENEYVLIPAGTYNIASTITIPSDRKVQIEGTINIGCAVGFLLNGEYIEICGKGTLNIGTNPCSAIKALVNKSIGFVKIRDITMWGAWNYNNSNNHIGVEFVGDATAGTCCYVNIDCYINCMTKAIWTHKATGQNASSWLTQIDINSTIQNCQQAIAFDWMGDMSRIRGVIQPKVTSGVTPNSVELPLCVLPAYAYMDAALWDMDAAINKYAIKVSGNYCTVLSEIGRSYMDVDVAYEPSLMLRTPTGNLVTKEYFEENKPSLNVNFHIDNDGNLIMQENAPYLNLVPSGKDTNGSILNGTGYVDNYRISASGNITGQTGTVLTGFIPYKDVSDADDIKTKGVRYVAELYCGIMFYDEDFKLMGGLRLIEGQEPTLLNETVAVLNTSGSSVSVDEDGMATIHINFIEDNLVNNPVSYFRLFAKGKGSDLIVTRKEKIVPYNPTEKNVGKVVPDSDYSTEDWEFTLEDGSTVTKKVVLA